MLAFGSITAITALAGALVLGTPSPTPTDSGSPGPSPTPTPTESPTTPPEEAAVTVTPSTITTEGGTVVVGATCPDGTDGSVVVSDAFGRHPFRGATKITVKTVTGLKIGAYQVELFCDGDETREASAQTTLTVVAATPRPTPSGPPQTGDGATRDGPGYGSVLLVTGLGLIGVGAVAGTVALRRRREGA